MQIYKITTIFPRKIGSVAPNEGRTEKKEAARRTKLGNSLYLRILLRRGAGVVDRAALEMR